MDQHCYIDRESGQKRIEPVYCERTMNMAYGSRFGRSIANFLSSYVIFSQIYGWVQRQSFTKRKIQPFIDKYGICAQECEKAIEDFESFDDFFTRKLKKNSRPITPGEDVLVAPADGRYLIYRDISDFGEFIVKSSKFSLESLVGSNLLAQQYRRGSMVIIRLAPFDYHRFHFPCDCEPLLRCSIPGKLFSVHPLAMRDYFVHFCENKRELTTLKSKVFGSFLYLEIGAMNVGSIQNTFEEGKPYLKGDEKGFFSFGGSSIVMLFKRGTIIFDDDLVSHSRIGLETFCKVGQSIGRSSGMNNR